MNTYRISRFDGFKSDAWFKRVYARLKPNEVEFCRRFIRQHNDLDQNEFEKAVNRCFLDKPLMRENYRNWKCILELLAASNTGFSKHHGGPDLLFPNGVFGEK